MVDIVTFADKIDNTETTASASNIPITQKLPASHVNQLKAGVNLNHVDILVLQSDVTGVKTKTDNITISSPLNLNTMNTSINTINTTLVGKADTSHTHAITDIIGLQSSLQGKVNTTIWNNFSVFIPYETPSIVWSQIIPFTGLTMDDAIIVNKDVYTQDMDNESDTIDLIGITAIPLTDFLEITLQFSTPTTGNIQLKYKKVQ